jgi:peptidase M23-like protein
MQSTLALEVPPETTPEISEAIYVRETARKALDDLISRALAYRTGPELKAPAVLSHRIAYDFSATDHLATVIGKKQIEGPIVSVNQAQPTLIASPLAGTGWVATSGCCSPNVHRDARLAATDRIATPETFAIDWLRIDEGKFYKNDGSRNEDWSCFGVPVRSASDGEVIGVRNDMPDGIPSPKQPATAKTPFDYGGNFVSVRIRPDLYAFYAHLQPGTVTVKAGDRVKTGTVLGKLGNSGNSFAPISILPSWIDPMPLLEIACLLLSTDLTSREH